MKIYTNNQYKALALAFHNLKEENEQLKEENRKLKEVNGNLRNMVDFYEHDNKFLTRLLKACSENNNEDIDFPNSQKGEEGSSIWET